MFAIKKSDFYESMALNKVFHIPFDTMIPIVFEEWKKDPKCIICKNT